MSEIIFSIDHFSLLLKLYTDKTGTVQMRMNLQIVYKIDGVDVIADQQFVWAR